ncbi:hypothetical protein H1W37_19335 [Stappia taiwanensis]|uniref:DNA-binding protein n=1 Tax=Stappia taiwanensis TaxID=992267 RepID=A0A838XVQ8_9HYPH|nr:hypothetical protein [Stappia taiwanensis]MBA4613817.1 hypothetical protein [Stappia taiwanensis]
MIGIDELARELGTTPAKLKRVWPELHRRKGMPRKHSAGWVWPRALTVAWLTGQAGIRIDVGGNDNDETPSLGAHQAMVDAQRAALHARYGGRS